MKILQVVHYFPPAGRGGSEQYTHQLSRALRKSDDVRVFYTASQDGDPNRTECGSHDGIPYWKLRKNYSNFNEPFHERNKWTEQEFQRALDSFKPEIVHFQHLINLSLKLPSLAKKKGVPSCFTLHDFWLLCPRNFLLNRDLHLCPGGNARLCTNCLGDRISYYNPCSRGFFPLRVLRKSAKHALNWGGKSLLYFSLAIWRPFLIKKIFADVDMFIAPSRFLFKKFVRAGLSEKKMVICRHGSDTSIFRNAAKTPSAHLRFAYIGGLRPHKGIDTLIKAFNTIKAPHELKIYGHVTPQLKDELQKKISTPHIHIMGELRPDDKNSAFSSIDVLILPSICYENSPLVISEAFITRTPVIVSDLGGMAELVQDGKTGLTFPPGDSSGLAQKIMMFIEDKHLKDTLAEQIPDVKKIDAHASELSEIYRKLARVS